MLKIVKNSSAALRTRYGVLLGVILDMPRILRSPHFWDGFRDGFKAWIWWAHPDLMPSKRRRGGRP